MHDANGCLAVKCLARAAVVQLNLRLGRCKSVQRGSWVVRWVSQIQHGLNFFLCRAVKDRSGKRNTFGQVAGHFHDLCIRQTLDVFFLAITVVNLVEVGTHFAGLVGRFKFFLDPFTQTTRCPTQVGFKNLSDVHPRGYPQRVQHDVDWRAIGHERHVFNRHNL